MVPFFRRPAALSLLVLAAALLTFAGLSAYIGATGPTNFPAPITQPIVRTPSSSPPIHEPRPAVVQPVYADDKPAASRPGPPLTLAMMGVLVWPKPPLLEEREAIEWVQPASAITPNQQPSTLRPPPQWSAKEMQASLLQVPEIWLQHPSTTYIPQTGRARGLQHPLLKVIDGRPDLQGLPVRRKSELQLPADETQAFRDVSVLMRKALSELAGQDRSANRRLAIRPEVLKARPDVSARVMHQMLQIESASLRRVLLGHLKQNRDPAAARALAHRAVYEPLADIRQTAVAALAGRPVGDFLPVLLDAFSSPWPPAADHAADTLIRLGASEAVPELIRKLDESAPATTVRELVRVNHARNCLLCHAQSVDRSDDIRVAVPSPTRALPPSFSLDTYEGGGGGQPGFARRSPHRVRPAGHHLPATGILVDAAGRQSRVLAGAAAIRFRDSHAAGGSTGQSRPCDAEPAKAGDRSHASDADREGIERSAGRVANLRRGPVKIQNHEGAKTRRKHEEVTVFFVLPSCLRAFVVRLR